MAGANLNWLGKLARVILPKQRPKPIVSASWQKASSLLSSRLFHVLDSNNNVHISPLHIVVLLKIEILVSKVHGKILVSLKSLFSLWKIALAMSLEISR